MIMQFGMSRRLGPVIYGEHHGTIFLGREIGEQRNYSEETAKEIDQEVTALLKEAYSRALNILGKHISILRRVAAVLIEKETVDGKELEKFFTGIAVPDKVKA
jgi:cell division protease FtsH